MNCEKMKIAIDASSLIFLVKINKLDLVLKEYGKLYTSSEVLSEVISGLELGYKDAIKIKKQFESKKIIEMKSENLRFDPKLGLHIGEHSPITSAKKNNIKHIIIDDYVGLKIAKYYGLKPLSLPFLFLSLLKKNKLNFREFIGILDNLLKEGYYLSTYLYEKIIRKAKEK